jgi:hypothetical protein
VGRARSGRQTIFASGKLTELDLSPVRVAVNVDVGYTHGSGWNVFSGQIWCVAVPVDVGNGLLCICVLYMALFARVVCDLGWYGIVFIQISQWVDVSLQCRVQKVIGLLVLFGV